MKRFRRVRRYLCLLTKTLIEEGFTKSGSLHMQNGILPLFHVNRSCFHLVHYADVFRFVN